MQLGKGSGEAQGVADAEQLTQQRESILRLVEELDDNRSPQPTDFFVSKTWLTCDFPPSSPRPPLNCCTHGGLKSSSIRGASPTTSLALH